MKWLLDMTIFAVACNVLAWLLNVELTWPVIVLVVAMSLVSDVSRKVLES